MRTARRTQLAQKIQISSQGAGREMPTPSILVPSVPPLQTITNFPHVSPVIVHSTVNDFINVHTFDGKLKGIFKPSRQLAINEKIVLFGELISHLSNPHAIETVKIIANDMSKNASLYSNIQVHDNLDASDILGDICIRKYEDVINYLEEQLADAKLLGICSSGTVTRLLQIWISLFDSTST